MPAILADEQIYPAAELRTLIGNARPVGPSAESAGYGIYRRPGMRDPSKPDHPTMRRLERTTRHWEASADAIRIAMLRNPSSRAQLLRALVYRFAPLFGDGCPLDRIYVDEAGRDYANPLYAARPRDGDHCSGELMRMTVGFSLLDYFELLDQLRVDWPELFDAAWTRNSAAVEKLIGSAPDRLPLIALRPRKARAEAMKAVLGLFWELERLFELLFFLGGDGGVTRRRLVAALWSSSSLSMEIRAGTRAGRYLATTWCHRFAHMALFEGWWGAPDPTHAHHALGPEGDVSHWQDAAGTSSDYGQRVAQTSIFLSAPFERDPRTPPAPRDPFAMFFAGRDARSLAFHFLLELREELGGMWGRYDRPSPLFELDPDSAIGRLATLITANICPTTGQAIFDAGKNAAVKRVHKGVKKAAAPLGALIANPSYWNSQTRERLNDRGQFEDQLTSTARYSRGLGEHFLARTVRKIRDGRASNDPLSLAKAGATARFSWRAWFEREAEERHLGAAWRTIAECRPVAHAPLFLNAYPGLFQPVDADTLSFCVGVAARLIQGANDMFVDPAFRRLPHITTMLAHRGKAPASIDEIRAEIERRVQQRRKKWRP